MDTETIKLDVHVTAWFRTPLSGFLSSVIISRDREFEEFIIDGHDDSVTSLGSYRDPSRGPDPLIFLNFQNFEPNYVYQLLQSQLHDHVLSEQIAGQILVEAQRLRSQSSELPQQPLFMMVSVKLTQKGYTFGTCNSATSTTDLDHESEEDESET
ncbi:uncharacterized protein LOC9314823 [Arabidopsis lyrata subsp. lyrata]|nr:uncharacterized protein LOC9314823 [Arabidopsis lyrata subsp. lyrata]|eukprot:XP_020883097.1 uncharacterized protein LOC9314823 [Arabidopsis lyrata subsp. lyrata]